MAYQEGIIRLRGTDLGITYYKLNGQYHVRAKSSLTAKKFFNHPSFANSRRSCTRFAEGNKLASLVYRSLPQPKRQYALFCQLKTLAIAYIGNGKEKEEILSLLCQRAQQEEHLFKNKPKQRKRPKPFPYAFQITTAYVAISVGRMLQLQKKFSEEELIAMASLAIRKQTEQQAILSLLLARA